MPVRIIRTSIVVAVATLFAAVAVWGQAPQKNWKDRAEYDLADGIQKATDNNKKLELLNTWKQKYPTSDFNLDRLQLFLVTYSALNQPDKVLETGAEILAADPKNLQALYYMTISAMRIPKPTPDQLATVQKAGRTLTSSIDALRPATTSEADWNKGKPDILAPAYMTLGWISMQQKAYEESEKEFTECLKVNPNNGQVSYWLGTVILAQRNADKQVAGLYHIARAASYSGPGAYAEPNRKQAADYLAKAYTTYHGSTEGLDELRKIAAEHAFPPQDLKILSKVEIDAEKEEADRRANPMLALWKRVKTELTGENGATYFEGGVKGALLPGGADGIKRFKAKLVAAKPPKNPKELVVSIGDTAEGEATLIMDEALVGSAPVGTELEFEGVPASYTANPFMLTFEVAPDQLSGWPVAAPPAKKAPGVKKAAPVKK
ncbi:MAG: hypothetical protein ACE141_02460 [Bryobacteraceae bacterium]